MKEIKITKSITPRESKAMTRYLSDIANTHPLTPEEEVELAVRIQQGDEEARNSLVTANLRFVVSVAKQYQNLGIPLEDLINEGNIGLIRAAERFDHTRGFKFATFAVWWIRQAISAYVAINSRAVRLPQNVTDKISRIRSASAAFEQEHLRQPTTSELADLVGLEEEKIDEYMNAYHHSYSLDAPLSNDTDTCVADMLVDSSVGPTDSQLMSESLRDDLLTVINTLPERERKVIELHFGLHGKPISLEMIAIDMHITRERVRQLREKAIRHLQNTQTIRHLACYLSV